MTDYIAFGNRLRELRLEKGLSQSALSALTEDTGTRGQIAKYELGLRKPTAEALTSLAAVLGVTPRYLLLGEEGTEEPKLRDTTAPRRDKFRVQGKPRGRTTIQIYPDNAATIRRLSLNYGLSTADLVSQLLDYCVRNLEA